MRFVVFGAGAVGSTLGGFLALHKNKVLLVCRKGHAEAINSQKGLKMFSATGEYFARLRATDKLGDFKKAKDLCILFTPKSNGTRRCAEELKKSFASEAPLLTFQNGISNEELLGKEFHNLYGGVCKMTCSFLHPGQVTFRKAGRLVVGKYPKGADPFANRIAGIFEASGFQCTVSRSIMCDKWLKLVVNLQSTFNAIIDSRDHGSIEFTKLKVGVMEEAKKVLRADKIKAKSCDGRDFSIDEMIKDLNKPRAQRASPYLKVHNSTWQNLYLKRKEIENSYFHRPIIDLAAKHNIDVPFNEIALERVQLCHKKRLGPEAYRAAEVLQEIEERKRGI